MVRRLLVATLLMFTVGLAVEPVHAAFEVPEGLAPTIGSGRVTAMPQFELEISGDGESELVLGTNAFSPQQLLQFVSALPDFLEGAVNLSEGQTLVLRQAGIRGYVALAAVYDSERGTIRYTLTLQAEAPSSVSSMAAVQGLGFEIANMLLTRE